MNGHCNHLALKFSVCVKERQDRLPTMYWLPKLHKRPYKARFIANSSSCTTTELSKLLTSCLTAVKNHVIRYCEKVYERSGKNLFWSIKNSGEVLNKLKSRGFRATSLSTYDFSTLYTTLPHNLIKEKIINLFVCLFVLRLNVPVNNFSVMLDGAIASWVINQYFRGVKCLAQGHNTAAVGFEPPTSRSGVQL